MRSWVLPVVRLLGADPRPARAAGRPRPGPRPARVRGLGRRARALHDGSLRRRPRRPARRAAGSSGWRWSAARWAAWSPSTSRSATPRGSPACSWWRPAAVMGDPAAGLARADEVAAAPWDAAAVKPVVAGFFREPPPPERFAEYRRIAPQTTHAAAVEAARSNAQSRTLDRLGEIRGPDPDHPGPARPGPDPRARGGDARPDPGARLEVLEDAGPHAAARGARRLPRPGLPFLRGSP